MSLIVNIWRIVASAWKNFARNMWLALTTVFVLVLALLSVNVLLGVNTLLGNAVRELEQRIDISVYFKNDTPEQVLEQARFFMNSLPQVNLVELVPADKALERFKETHADDPKILSALGELDGNPLGATLVIKARSPSDYPFLLEALKNPQFEFAVESMNYDDHAETINRVRDIDRSIQLFGTGLIAVFALFSILIVFNTVRVAIYTQREEIGIMRLVGASNAYVRLPFVLEGVLLALLALLISGVVVYMAAVYVDPRLSGLFDGGSAGLVNYFTTEWPRLALIQGGGLAFLVALSSWAAVGKYLRK
jgi:cell division transport system permease protein